jgi:hypothetical protein
MKRGRRQRDEECEGKYEGEEEKEEGCYKKQVEIGSNGLRHLKSVDS